MAYLQTDQESNKYSKVCRGDFIDRVDLEDVSEEEAVEQDVTDEVGPNVDTLVVETEQALEAGQETQLVFSVPGPDVGVRSPRSGQCV